MLTTFICWILSRKKLNASDKQKLTNEILKAIDALPLHAIITVDEGKIFIRGVPLDGERAMVLRESADKAIHNPALQLVHEQALYLAVSLGIHQAQTTEQIQFAKAAIWYSQQEIALLKKLSTGDANELLVNGD